ncbi:MAG: DUF4386 domain-containing protein [Imperialibacter sp.]|uniref:DUF4386 domain-containing protein n=1 Tax=Imperialibacter sp. TaxID=2038411 RepID=UPI0032EFF49E
MNESNKTTARIAGLLYLAMGLTGGFGLMYTPSQIVVAGDAAATVANIVNHEMLFRLGIVTQLVCQVIFVYLVLKLYQLFKPVDELQARQMLGLVLASVPIAFVIVLNQLGMLLVGGGAGFLSTFTTDQLNALSMILFSLYENGVVIAQIFWGLWLIPFGRLVYASGFIPRIFGILLIVGGLGYVVASGTALLLPQYGGIVGTIATIPSAIAEFAIIFWFLIKGVRAPKLVGAAVA